MSHTDYVDVEAGSPDGVDDLVGAEFGPSVSGKSAEGDFSSLERQLAELEDILGPSESVGPAIPKRQIEPIEGSPGDSADLPPLPSRPPVSPISPSPVLERQPPASRRPESDEEASPDSRDDAPALLDGPPSPSEAGGQPAPDDESSWDEDAAPEDDQDELPFAGGQATAAPARSGGGADVLADILAQASTLGEHASKPQLPLNTTPHPTPSRRVGQDRDKTLDDKTNPDAGGSRHAPNSHSVAAAMPPATASEKVIELMGQTLVQGLDWFDAPFVHVRMSTRRKIGYAALVLLACSLLAALAVWLGVRA